MAEATTPTPAPLLTRNETNIDWSNLKLGGRRFANAFLLNEWRSDMTFKMSSGSIIPAHTLIVGSASSMLEKCCFGNSNGLEEKTVVNVPKFTSDEDFLVVLQYLYGEYTSDSRSLGDDLNDKNVVGILNIADHFDLIEVSNASTQFIENIMSPSNVCSFFHSLGCFRNSILLYKCLDFMHENISAIMANGTFMDEMDVYSQKRVLAEDALKMNSKTCLVKAMVDWADRRCGKELLEVTATNRRKFLTEKFCLLRFENMSFREFYNAVRMFGDGLFSEQEMSQMAEYIFTNHVNQTPFIGHGQEFWMEFKLHSPQTIQQHDFILDTSGLGYTITLDCIILKHKEKMHVFNVLTNKNVVLTNYNYNGWITFDKGIEPTSGRIHLRLTMENCKSFNGYHIQYKRKFAFFPSFESDVTCVSDYSFTALNKDTCNAE